MKKEYRDVHMKLWPQTVEKIDNLRFALSLQNNTEAVRAAIDIALLVVQEISAGSEIVISGKRNKKYLLSIAGLSR